MFTDDEALLPADDRWRGGVVSRSRVDGLLKKRCKRGCSSRNLIDVLVCMVRVIRPLTVFFFFHSLWWRFSLGLSSHSRLIQSCFCWNARIQYNRQSRSLAEQSKINTTCLEAVFTPENVYIKKTVKIRRDSVHSLTSSSKPICPLHRGSTVLLVCLLR